ncbi:hypothetical protein HDF16_002968 [Granulicella aggregans]|uniref:Glycosyltransferase RgtA/B/C/D-like domain-containing protein n=1 Tax=Granulicella aggregans TaxID=474949 RepID=A0A7W7ZE59_9BACT|nr:glycosyltransferase family 39 protein [Granulicella aggregans]MBB5058254.1 hypothetical protein [Granulicella aggregans]
MSEVSGGSLKRVGVWSLAAIALVCLFFAQCVRTAKMDSVSWDESQHLYSGWLSWTHADFGFNPEVPPLVKMWDAIPLLHRDIQQPPYTGDEFKKEGFVLGQRFLAANGIDRTLIPARTMAAILSALLAITIFLAAREMFGDLAAIFALALFTFDPNFLAHGSYVTTDIGASLMTLLAVYAYYRVVKRPSMARMVVLGLAVGLALTAKFTGIFIVPILAVISLLELWRRRDEGEAASGRQMAVALVVASAIGFVCVWAIYRFRYAARPDGLALNPLTGAYLQQLTSPLSRGAMVFAARIHLLPEGYLYGLADTKISAASLPSYFFGHLTHGASRWYYPGALAIKSTLPFLILLVATVIALVSRRWRVQREVIFLAVPTVVLFSIACASDIGIGYRHLLPIIPLCYILIAGCVSYFVSRDKKLAYAFGVLLVWQVVGSFAARPGLLAYANEAWGGPSKTHLYLSDSNTDFGQQLRYVKRYLDEHPGRPCYFAYYEQGAADFRDYGIQCQVLPTGAGAWTGIGAMHFGNDPNVSGLVLVSDGILAGTDIPGKMNPYASFREVTPSAVIDRAVNVYEGSFRLGPAAALEHVEAAGRLQQTGNFQAALGEATEARTLDPESAVAWKAAGDALEALKRPAEAQTAYRSALGAGELDPVFGKAMVEELQKKTGGGGR